MKDRKTINLNARYIDKKLCLCYNGESFPFTIEGDERLARYVRSSFLKNGTYFGVEIDTSEIKGRDKQLLEDSRQGLEWRVNKLDILGKTNGNKK